MIIALMACWVVAGLLLALLVGGAVRIAESRGHWTLEARDVDGQPVEVEAARAG